MLLILINVLRIKLLSVKNGNSMTSLGLIIIIGNSEETLILVRWVYCEDNKVLIRKDDKLHNGNVFCDKEENAIACNTDFLYCFESLFLFCDRLDREALAGHAKCNP